MDKGKKKPDVKILGDYCGGSGRGGGVQLKKIEYFPP